MLEHYFIPRSNFFTAYTFHQCDDFIFPSPKASFMRKLFSWTGGIKSNTAAANTKKEELRHRSIKLHLNSMTQLLLNFLNGLERHVDQLIDQIAIACQQINDHLVMANVGEHKKSGPTVVGQADLQKVMGYAHLQCVKLSQLMDNWKPGLLPERLVVRHSIHIL